MAKKRNTTPSPLPTPVKPPTLREQIVMERVNLEKSLRAHMRMARLTVQRIRDSADDVKSDLDNQRRYGQSDAARISSQASDLCGALVAIEEARTALESLSRLADLAGVPWTPLAANESPHLLYTRARAALAESAANSAEPCNAPVQKDASQ